jgi:hypothetical protein
MFSPCTLRSPVALVAPSNLYSPAQALRSWGRISLETWIFFFILCLCWPVQVEALRQGWSPVQGVLQTVHKAVPYLRRLVTDFPPPWWQVSGFDLGPGHLGVFGGQSSTWAGFLRELRFLLPIFIPQSPQPIIWGLYNRPVVAAVPSGFSLTPLRIIINNNCP